MELWHDRILVLDFGSQFTQLIARRLRDGDPAGIELEDQREIAGVIGTPPKRIPASADFSAA